jgi:arylsulfatase A-like enzyme
VTIATELHRDRVVTGYIGKYLNGYADLWEPPGWVRWQAGIVGQYRYLPQTTYNDNGVEVDRPGYETTVHTRLATDFIDDAAHRSFFLTVNFLAPHDNVGGAEDDYASPSVHYRDTHNGAQVPRDSGFNEPFVGDKPLHIRKPSMTNAEVDIVDRGYENRLESLETVDDGMEAIRQTLFANHLLNDTNVIFVSDNGYLLGEHRIVRVKTWAYEESARVPFLMAGPDVPQEGVAVRALAGHHDIAPTILDLLGTGPMPGADGQSLLAPAAGRDIVLQGYKDTVPDESYRGLVTPGNLKYVEYQGGGVELYDLDADVSEVSNLAQEAEHQGTVAALHARLQVLKDCAGASCR